MDRDICTDFMEIVTGTTNMISPVYREAADHVDKNDTKAQIYMKNFFTSINQVANKTKSKSRSLAESKGNIKSFKGYHNIEKAFEILNKYAKKIHLVKDLHTIHDMLIKYAPLYTRAYEARVDLVTLEYESALDTLVTCLSMIMSSVIDVEASDTDIKIVNKNAPMIHTFEKMGKEFAKQLSNKNHEAYLEKMVNAKHESGMSNADAKTESVFIEGAVQEWLDLAMTAVAGVKSIGPAVVGIARGIKNSLFGIIPLIRSALYLRYKRKADTVLALDQQVIFIERNIEQLKNRKNMDPREKALIIKKQKAYIEAYKKKAEKLRAELSDGEREASEEIKKEDPKMGNTNDDDFVLEQAGFINGILNPDMEVDDNA